jgi:hypothetical protein
MYVFYSNMPPFQPSLSASYSLNLTQQFNRQLCSESAVRRKSGDVGSGPQTAITTRPVWSFESCQRGLDDPAFPQWIDHLQARSVVNSMTSSCRAVKGSGLV